MKKNLVVLLSGRGSNLEAIAAACEAEQWNARIVRVVSNRPDAPGLAVARERGIATTVVDHRGFASREAFDAALGEVVAASSPDGVLLAGFMRLLGHDFVARYEGRMLNVHPSLLPAFAGLQTHRRAIEAGCRIAGATVHFVTAELDHGPIVIQAAVPVRSDDTPESLAARVLEQEHRIYPRAVRWFVEGRLRIEPPGRVVQLDGEPQWLFWPGSPDRGT